MRIEDIAKVSLLDGTEHWMTVERAAPRSGKWTLAPIRWAKDAEADRTGAGWREVRIRDLRPGDVISVSEDAKEAVTGRLAWGSEAWGHSGGGRAVEPLKREDVTWPGVAMDSILVLKTRVSSNGYCDIEGLEYPHSPTLGKYRWDADDSVIVWCAPDADAPWTKD